MAGTPFKIKDQAFTTQGLFDRAAYGKLFAIRPPQRRYKWTSTEVNRLWHDVLNAYRSERDSYFMGTLIVTPLDNTTDKVSVLDGQQRLATITLLIAVLRDYCLAYENKKMSGRASGLQELITRLDNNRQPTGELIISLQDGDHSDFLQLVEKPNSTNSLDSGLKALHNKSHLLTQAVLDFRVLVNRDLQLASTDADRLANSIEV